MRVSYIRERLFDNGNDFFSRKNLEFFEQTMKDFGCCQMDGKVYLYAKRGRAGFRVYLYDDTKQDLTEVSKEEYKKVRELWVKRRTD